GGLCHCRLSRMVSRTLRRLAVIGGRTALSARTGEQRAFCDATATLRRWNSRTWLSALLATLGRNPFGFTALPLAGDSADVSQSKNLVHALCQVTGGFEIGCLVAWLLGDRPAGVARAVQCVHHRRPVRVAVEQFWARARPGTRRRRLRAEILDMDSPDAFSEESNPLFRRTYATRVAYVEMPAHPLAVDRVEICDRLLGRHDKVVPDVLDRDFHTGIPCHRNGLLDFHEGTLKTLLIRHAIAGDTRNQQH